MKHDPSIADPETPNRQQALLLPGLTVEAFAEHAQTLQVLRRAQRNRSFTRMTWRFREGGVKAAIAEYRERASPDLLILESDEESDYLLPMLEDLSAQCGDNTRVLMIGVGGENEVALFRNLLKLGVSDYLPAPVDALQVVSAVLDIYRDNAEVKLGKVTAFLGAGGGTGSSTIAQNAAVAMARLMDTDVLLADFDPQYGTVGLNFDVEDSYAITDVLRRGSRVDDLLIERITRKMGPRLGLLTVEPSVDNRPDMPSSAVSAILDLANAMPRHVVLDMTHVWTLRTKNTLARADHVVMTTMPTLAGLRNARNLMPVLRRIRTTDAPPILVINKIGLPKRLEVPLRDFREALELETIFEIPYNASLFSRAQAQGDSAIDRDEGSKVSREIIRLARLINDDLNNGDPRSMIERMSARLRKWW